MTIVLVNPNIPLNEHHNKIPLFNFFFPKSLKPKLLSRIARNELGKNGEATFDANIKDFITPLNPR